MSSIFPTMRILMVLGNNKKDGLSLAMFEALRGLRDAVAPESGNLGVAAGGTTAAAQNQPSNTTTSEPRDMDELWHAYRNGDREVVAMIQNVISNSSTSGGGTISAPQRREDFIRLHAKMEMEKDKELVSQLAGIVLEKSGQIDEQVDRLPGMHRTRAEQMSRIQELMEANRLASQELEAAYHVAKEKRNTCRRFVLQNTCSALGIEGGNNNNHS